MPRPHWGRGGTLECPLSAPIGGCVREQGPKFGDVCVNRSPNLQKKGELCPDVCRLGPPWPCGGGDMPPPAGHGSCNACVCNEQHTTCIDGSDLRCLHSAEAHLEWASAWQTSAPVPRSFRPDSVPQWMFCSTLLLADLCASRNLLSVTPRPIMCCSCSHAPLPAHTHARTHTYTHARTHAHHTRTPHTHTTHAHHHASVDRLRCIYHPTLRQPVCQMFFHALG